MTPAPSFALSFHLVTFLRPVGPPILLPGLRHTALTPLRETPLTRSKEEIDPPEFSNDPAQADPRRAPRLPRLETKRRLRKFLSKSFREERDSLSRGVCVVSRIGPGRAFLVARRRTFLLLITLRLAIRNFSGTVPAETNGVKIVSLEIDITRDMKLSLIAYLARTYKNPRTGKIFSIVVLEIRPKLRTKTWIFKIFPTICFTCHV